MKENCWFLASPILDFLLKLPLPDCQTAIHGTTRNNGIAPALRSRIKARYLVEEGAESLSLTVSIVSGSSNWDFAYLSQMEEWLVLALLTQTP